MSDADKSESRIRHASVPFRLKLTIVAGLLAVVPLIIVGIAVLNVNSNAIEVRSREFQLAVVEDVSRTIESQFTEAENGLDAVGTVITDSNVAEEEAVVYVKSLVGANDSIDHVGVYAVDGLLLDVVRQSRAANVNLPERLDPELLKVATEDKVATGMAEVVAGESARVMVVTPLKVGNKVSGFVASKVSLARLQDRVSRLAEVRFEDHENALFVIDRDQRLLLHPDEESAHNLTVVKGQGILKGLDPSMLKRKMQQSGEFTNADGEKMIGTLAVMEHQPWAIVAQLPEAVAYKSLSKVRTIVISTILLAVLLALGLAFLIAKQITQPIDELSQFASDLANRKFDRRVTLNTRDEFGVLSDVMSAAAADLQVSENRIREEVAIRSDLGRYLPAELVDKVVKREQDMALGGSRREVTVLFADIVAFTPMTEELAAEEVVALLNELFTILTEIVFRHGGIIDKFIGDCVMAIFGAPKPMEEHASAAIAAAEDMMRWLEAGNAGWKEKYNVTIELAIGVNTGDAIVGNVGSETRMEYTAIGDMVNVAARLESVARPSQILVSAATQAAAGDEFDFVEIGPRQMTGRPEPVVLFEVRV